MAGSPGFYKAIKKNRPFDPSEKIAELASAWWEDRHPPERETSR